MNYIFIVNHFELQVNNFLREVVTLPFGENLKHLRETREITQQQMADKLEMTRQAYAKYEQGKREPSFSTLKIIKEILSCSYDDILK